jgi:hypothetical protein
VRTQPIGTHAHRDAAEHGRLTGHAATEVRAWWRSYCRPCGASSEACERARDAWTWLDSHERSNRNHLRWQALEAEWEAIADRIVAAGRWEFASPVSAPPAGERP